MSPHPALSPDGRVFQDLVGLAARRVGVAVLDVGQMEHGLLLEVRIG